MTTIERFYQYLKEEELNLPQLEKKHNIPNGHFNKIKSRNGGITEITMGYIIKIFPDLNLYWLLTGEGQSKYSKQKASSKELVFQENIRLKKEVLETHHALDFLLKKFGVVNGQMEEMQMSISSHGNRLSEVDIELGALKSEKNAN